MNFKATSKFERERYLQRKHAETIGKSYYANVHMFSNLKPLTDSEGKNIHPRICKGDETKEEILSVLSGDEKEEVKRRLKERKR